MSIGIYVYMYDVYICLCVYTRPRVTFFHAEADHRTLNKARWRPMAERANLRGCVLRTTTARRPTKSSSSQHE